MHDLVDKVGAGDLEMSARYRPSKVEIPRQCPVQDVIDQG